MSASKSTLLIIRKPPFGSIDSWEALRLSLSFYSASSPVTILLEDSGIFNWLSGIVAETVNPNSVSRFVRDIEQFDIPVSIIKEDLDKHGVSLDDLASRHPKLIQRSEVANLVATHDQIMAM
jgi:sulfur relay (sulfurtransferase) DsrF/TusC family protein